MEKTRLQELLAKQATHGLDDSEAAALADLMDSLPEADQLAAMTEVLEEMGKDTAPATPDDLRALFDRVVAVDRPHARRRTLPRFTWWAAAALVAGIAVTMWFRQGGNPDHSDNGNTAAAAIQPGREGAILTLADGSQLELDSLGNGTVALQNGTTVRMQNGQLQYEDDGSSAAPAQNTMYTPRGRQFRIVLPDGTRVWLNAASSITYPTAFSGAERLVTLEGEAYFEVAKNEKQPFRVHLREGTSIKVLGTHFNVNAYPDEQTIRTTLLEGAVAVASGSSEVRIRPGEAAAGAPGRPMQVTNADVQEAVAWKNGLFAFTNADIRQVMRSMARWYDVDVVFAGKATEDGFTGNIPSNVPLSQFLQLLELNDIPVKLEGRTITVLNNQPK